LARYTVDYGARNPSAQRVFLDIAAVLQKISNGAEFSSAHRLFAINADVRALSIALHDSITKTFASFEPPRHLEAPAPPDANDSSLQSANKTEIKRFLSILIEAADAQGPSAFDPASSLRASLVYLVNHSSFGDVKLVKATSLQHHGGADDRPSSAPHWACVSSFLNQHPSFAAAYEHFFPPISESGASVETVTIGLLLGKTPSIFAVTLKRPPPNPPPPPPHPPPSPPALQALPSPPSSPWLLAPAAPRASWLTTTCTCPLLPPFVFVTI
jgi:hypothetical protein